MAYKYAGTIHDVEDEPTTRTKPLGSFNADACGTYAGYRRHQRYNVPACRDCKDAQASYSRDYIERRGGYQAPALRPFVPGACGTYAGYARHLRSEVKPCQECHAAWLQYRKDWRARKQAA